MLVEVLSLNLVVEIMAAGFGDEQGFGGPSTFKSYLSSVLKLTNKQVVLDDPFGTFIPVDVSRDGLLNKGLLAFIFREVAVYWLLLLRSSNLRSRRGSILLAELAEEIGGTFSRHLRESRLHEGVLSGLG
uniref:Uncharacterized protein n=1 Tax=Strombidium inclinatum TaxID=197538 RepID=A0A7S3IUC0_9SPIT